MRIAKWIVPAVALALVVAWSANAEMDHNAATGTVKGVVYQADGTTPAANAQVGLKAAPAKKNKAEKNATGLVEEGQPKAEAGMTTTAGDGTFTLQAPAGEYMIAAKAKGMGMAKQPVTITAGETTQVTLTLAAPQPKKEGEPKKEKEKKQKKEGQN